MAAVGAKSLSVSLKCAGQRMPLQKTTDASRYVFGVLKSGVCLRMPVV